MLAQVSTINARYNKVRKTIFIPRSGPLGREIHLVSHLTNRKLRGVICRKYVDDMGKTVRVYKVLGHWHVNYCVIVG